MSQGISLPTRPSPTLRPVGPDDGVLLWSVYRSARLEEVSAWGWGAEQVEGFLQMQWQIEQRARAMQHPHADHRIIVLEGRGVGRLLVERTKEQITVVDIALVPGARGLGVGTAVLGEVIAEASGLGVPVVLSVRPGNQAERLYRRLGFVVTAEDASDRSMALYPLAWRAAASDESRREECRTRT